MHQWVSGINTTIAGGTRKNPLYADSGNEKTDEQQPSGYNLAIEFQRLHDCRHVARRLHGFVVRVNSPPSLARNHRRLASVIPSPNGNTTRSTRASREIFSFSARIGIVRGPLSAGSATCPPCSMLSSTINPPG